MHEFLSPFGFGKLTGIDIAGEQSGVLPSREYKRKRFRNPSDGAWYPGDSVNFGIGQGYLATTAVQMVRVTATIANGGDVLVPHVVRATLDENGNPVHTFEPQVQQHVSVSAANLADLWDCADGFIVGTSLKHDGQTEAPVDLARVRALVRRRGSPPRTRRRKRSP
jgi:penicillin-binding protein 2